MPKGIKGFQKGHPSLITEEGRKKISIALKNRFFSKEHRKKISLAKRGKMFPQYRGQNANRWNGGRFISKGYIFIFQPNHPYKTKQNYVREHRLIIEQHLRRYLKPEEVIHHINNNPSDNRLKNLILFKRPGYHRAFHRWNKYNSNHIIFDGRNYKNQDFPTFYK